MLAAMSAVVSKIDEPFVAEALETVREQDLRTWARNTVGLTQTRKFLKKSRPEMALHGGDPAASEENDRGTRRDAGRIPRQNTGTAIGFGSIGQRSPLLCRCVALRSGIERLFLHVLEGFAQEAAGTARIIADLITDLRFDNSHDGSHKRQPAVVFAAVPPGVALVFDLGFVQVRQFMFFRLRTESQFVDVVEDLAEVVAAGDLVFDA